MYFFNLYSKGQERFSSLLVGFPNGCRGSLLGVKASPCGDWFCHTPLCAEEDTEAELGLGLGVEGPRL